MIVVDTNIVAYLLIRGERSETMDGLLEMDGEWGAPRLWLDEFLNILCTYERNGLIDAGESAVLLEDALSLLEEGTYEVPPERTLSVARRTGCCGYDSQYVALAEDLGVKLYTCDKKILAACPGLAIEPA